MTEKEIIEVKIEHLQARKKLITAEIDFKIELLKDSLVRRDASRVRVW